MTIPLRTPDLTALRAELPGRVSGPGEAAYAATCAVFVGGEPARPAAVVRPRDVGDVARAVRFARDEGLALAVRSGGHSLAGYGLSDGIVIDLSSMRQLQVDRSTRTAWAQTGLTAGAYTALTHPDGLVTGFGDTASVGIGGLTLGGGMGYLSRQHGLTIDNLLAAEVVTADGQVRVVDHDREPDLFWGLRGGGGNLGVVTRLQLRLLEIDTVVGGLLVLPATPGALAAFVAEADAAPERLTTMVDVVNAPPLPFLPEAYHGRPVLLATLCCTGPIEKGERAVAPFRRIAEPIVDLLGPMPYPGIYQDEDFGRPRIAVRTTFRDALVDEALAGELIERVAAAPTPMAMVHLRVLGGAIDRVPVDATAYAHRGRRIMAMPIALYHRAEDRPTCDAWAGGLGRLLCDRPGAYVNFLADEGEDRVRDAYPHGAFDRLARLKRRYDPGNLFARNQNVAPAVDAR